ncbi:MAG: cytidine deaminase [Armatimonadota bacterium]
MKNKLTEKLINLAFEARENAYAPYSNYKVGAALITSSEKIYTGSNVENSSFGLTVCAERCAAVKAVNDAERAITAIAIVSGSDILPTPCGACRQVLSEFSKDGEMTVIFANTEGKREEKKLKELLPYAFVFK